MATVLSNSEIVEAIGLPESILDELATAQGDEFSAKANQFLSALVNKIVYQKIDTMEFSNPFKRFDSYPIRYGDTIENVYVDKLTGYQFNQDATDPFSKTPPNVKSLYATINYEMQYATTIQDSLIRRAVLSEYGLMNLVNAILQSLITSRSIDEYQATINMLASQDIYSSTTELTSLDDVIHAIVNTYTDFALPSIDNNKAGVMSVCPPEHALLVIKQELLNKIDLDYLKGVYNLSKVNLVKQTIPVRDFKVVEVGTASSSLSPVGEDYAFVILDDRGFDNHVALQDGGMIYNPKGKYTNHFSNLWKIISFKTFFQAKAFKFSE